MLRIIYLLLGTLALIAGIIGIFLPLPPTTPLILVAAACFAKGSSRWHQWLLDSNYWGPTIRNWEENKSISKKAKLISIIFLNLSIALSIWFFRTELHVIILLVIIDGLVSGYLISLPLAEPHDQQN